MKTYNYVDGWVGLKFKDTYKIFCSWAGGYLHGDSWRINSGTVSIIEDQDSLEIKGYSGSIYRCNKTTYDMLTSYNRDALARIISELEKNNIQCVVFDSADEFIKSFRDAEEKGLI